MLHFVKLLTVENYQDCFKRLEMQYLCVSMVKLFAEKEGKEKYVSEKIQRMVQA